MTDELIQRLIRLIAEDLQSAPAGASIEQLAERLKQNDQIEQMIQVNTDSAVGYQIHVDKDAIAQIGIHLHDFDEEKLAKVLREFWRSLKPKGIRHNLPRSGVVEFVGREKELQHLHTKLQGSHRSTITAIQGMGGIGKTELALQYATHHLNQGTYPGGICWLTARDQEIGTQIVRFAQAILRLNLTDGLEISAQVAQCWDNWVEGNVLVIIDDVTGEDESTAYNTIKPYLPPPDQKFSVLLTTRLLHLGSSIQTFEIQILTENASLQLIESLVGVKRVLEEQKAAKALCEWLGYLPLALELVGRYLLQRPDRSLSEIQERLKSKRLEDNALRKRQADVTAAHESAAAAFELSWEQLTESEESMAYFFSLFALAPIPWELVEKQFLKGNETNIEDLREDLEDLRDVGLVGHSLLQRVGKKTYQLHQLIREFFQAKLEQSERVNEYKRRFCKVMTATAQEFPYPPTLEEIDKFAIKIPHLAEVATNLIDWLESEDLPWPFIGIGRFYKSQGAYEQSKFWWEKCVAMTKEYLGENHSDVASSLNCLAAIHIYQGNHKKAESLYNQALDIWEQQPIKCHIDETATLDSLAALYSEQGYYKEAVPLCEKALKLSRILLDKHPDLAKNINNLAALYYQQGRYKEVEQLYEEALEIRENSLGEQHPEVSESLSNLAVLYRKQGRYKEAESLYLRAIQIWEIAVGENHPFVSILLSNLATLYCEVGRYKEAESSYQKAFEINQNLGSEENIHSVTDLINLANLYYSQARYSEAEDLYLKVIELGKKILTKNHSYMIKTRINLAETYRSQERYKEAEDLYKELEKLKDSIEKHNPNIISIINNRALLYHSQGQYQEAEALYHEAINLWIDLRGENNLNVAQSKNSLAQLYHCQGRYQDALKLYQDALRIRKKLLGENHTDIASIASNLAG